MALRIGRKKPKLNIGSKKVKAIYLGGGKVYSSGNICVYNVDGVLYTQEYEDGEDVLHPTAFTVPAKTGYTLYGWSLTSGGEALTALTMGDDPITLYAVWVALPFTLTLDGSGWTGPIVSGGGFSDGPRLRTSAYGGVEIYGTGSSSTAFAQAYAYKNITTRGLTKATITCAANCLGVVRIGSVSVGFGQGFSGTKTMTIARASTQKLQIEVSSGGVTYYAASTTVAKIDFHD